MHINCPATDVSHVLNSYQDGGWNLKEAKECLQKKCVLQNDGKYVNVGSSIENVRSNALTAEDSKINIPQPSFESGSSNIQPWKISIIIFVSNLTASRLFLNNLF